MKDLARQRFDEACAHDRAGREVEAIPCHEESKEWRTSLPALEAEFADRWQLELGPELSSGRHASVRAVRTSDDTEAVLKLTGPGSRSGDVIACLRLWAGGPAPALLEADAASGAMLMERIVPGTAALDAPVDEVVVLLRQIHIPTAAGLPALVDTVRRRLDRAEGEGRVRGPQLAWARAAVDRLHEEATAPPAVHGNFGGNLLACARRGLCAIDPLPCAGDGTYDSASWVHAHGRSGRRARFEAIAAAAGLDRDRLRDWCGLIAVLD